MEYRKLSEVLSALPPEYAYTYRRKLLGALRLGLIDMVPVPGTVTLVRRDKRGQATEWTVQEHLVHDTPTFRTWHAREVDAWSDNAAAGSALRGLVVSEAALARGDVDFAEMAQRYRARLSPKKGRRGSGKKRAKKTVHVPTEAALNDLAEHP